MAKKNFIPQKYKVWIEARKKYHLSHAHIQMARELGLNPKKFGKLANNNQEPWKLPLPGFIEKIYYKRFKRDRPIDMHSIEDRVKDEKRKKEERKNKKLGANDVLPETEIIEQYNFPQYDDDIPF